MNRDCDKGTKHVGVRIRNLLPHGVLYGPLRVGYSIRHDAMNCCCGGRRKVLIAGIACANASTKKRYKKEYPRERFS